jgi:VWFA-related protein
MLRTASIAAIIILLLGVASGLTSSEHPSQETIKQPLLQYEVSVILKLIQVYVTDKSGGPVRDLTKDDFIVLDNGKPVTVTAFEKHELLGPGAGQSAEEAIKVVPTALPPPPTMINRKLFLFFDFAFNNQKGVGASLKAALHFLDTEVRPADEVAVLSYSMLRGLRVHEFLTSDHAKAREAVAALTAKEIAGRADEVENEYWQMAESSSYATGSRSSASEMNKIESARKESKLQTQNYIVALTTLAKALRLVSGQKSFLFFSTGVPSTLIHGNPMSYAHDDRQQNLNPTSVYSGTTKFSIDAGDSTLQPLYEAMLKEYSASGCSFYVFDTRESASMTSLFGYDGRQFDSSVGGFFSAGAVGSNASNPFVDDKFTGMDTLKRLSKQTGGTYFSNISLYEKNMDQVQGITGAYYVLGYSFPATADGKFHDIKVEVKRKGCQVKAQAGYFNPKPFREYSKLEKELQLFDLALNEKSDLEAPKTMPTAALYYDAGEGLRLRTISRIRGEALEGFDKKNVELVGLVFDDKENVVSLQRTAVDLTRFEGEDILFSFGIAAKPGSYKCRLVIRDLDTGRSAIGSAGAYVAAPTPMILAVYSPLLLVPEGPLAYLEGTAKGTLDHLMWRDIYTYDVAQYSPVIGGQTVSTGKVVVVVPFTSPGTGQTNVHFSANLINLETAQNLPVSSQPLNNFRRGNVEVQFLEFSIDQVPTGKYMLYINTAHKPSGTLASVHTPLSIRR